MIDHLFKHIQSKDSSYDFSILIPSWNNLPYLKLCIESIRQHSQFSMQIIVCINEGKDSTRKWIEDDGMIDYIYAPENLGICYGLNLCRSLVKAEYIIYMNDDMCVLPGWDTRLHEEIQKLDTKLFMLSATMIEPYDTGNACVIVRDYGTDIGSFDQKGILSESPSLSIPDWSGSTWPPNVLHIDLWDMVGGMSPEYSPGMYSDPDLSKKCYDAGVRIFKGVGNSLVYHFGSKSTKRVKKNKGKDQFLHKWQTSSREFTHKILKRGKAYRQLDETYSYSLSQKVINKLKIIKSWF